MSGLSEFQQEFTGDNLADYGVVYGVRTWNLKPQLPQPAWWPVDSIWSAPQPAESFQIHGLFGQQEWTPGVNNAKCLKFEPRYVGSSSLNTSKPHSDARVAHPSCSCGFYAFWEPPLQDLTTQTPDCLVGVIKAYGSATIGTKGFRASKAEIVAVWPLHLTFVADGVAPDLLDIGRYTWREFIGLSSYYRIDPARSSVLSWLSYKFPDVAVFQSYQAMCAEFPTQRPV